MAPVGSISGFLTVDPAGLPLGLSQGPPVRHFSPMTRSPTVPADGFPSSAFADRRVWASLGESPLE